MTTIDRPVTAIRDERAGSGRTVLETILVALAPLVPYILPVGGLALIVYAGFIVHQAVGFALAGLAMLVLDFQIRGASGG